MDSSKVYHLTTEDLINFTTPPKCACCPHMFEYKCRADKCPYEDKQETQVTPFSDLCPIEMPSITLRSKDGEKYELNPDNIRVIHGRLDATTGELTIIE